MTAQIRASFTFDSWDEDEVLDTQGTRIVRTTFRKAFTGDLEGTSRGEMVMAHAGPDSSAYAGFERVEGSAHGRAGAFVLAHNAAMADGAASLDVVVMAGSGTGEFAGLSGRASIDRSSEGAHSFTLDYDLATPR